MSHNKCQSFFNKYVLGMTVRVFVIFSVFAIILSPLYIKIETDIAFMIPVLVDIFPYLTELCELAGILVAYAYIIFSMCYFGASKTLLLVAIYVGLTLYKFLIQIPIINFVRGTPFEPINIFTSMILPFLLEILQAAVVFAIAFKVINKTNAFIAEKKALERKLPDYKFDEERLFFPFKKLFDLSNPYQRITFFTGIVVMISKMAQLFVIDINVGLPADATDLMWMIISYTFCVIIGLASYLFIIYLLLSIHKKQTEFDFR